MTAYITLAAGIFLLPGIYWGTMMLYRPLFREEKNRKRKLLCSIEEATVVLSAEIALAGIWSGRGKSDISDMFFDLLFVILAAMSVFCMTDYWERIVPNTILVVLILMLPVIMGLHYIWNREMLFKTLPSILSGFIFCGVVFGGCYLLSIFFHKSMGAGDVKLALVMGLYLTDEYVIDAVLYGCIAAMLFSFVQMIRKKQSRENMIPLVPFLFAGVVICYILK